uniref:Uncharacterized protein AlNc14C176G8129 n=1 Tax=Albugo laibachii Nc14 TaxID=890382 RepID=F0WNX4_9STRA|nr:conserved hypothetical protein [Albugo laibachii Nc14]|eukprot:CCA23017.1 conserved hypothetical protein [Albugo laibachii Nc14]
MSKQQQMIQLRKTIETLVATRESRQDSLFSPQVTFEDTAAGIAKAYYRIFRSGYKLEDTAIPSFLHAVIDPEMRAGSYLGIHLMFTQWKRYTDLLTFTHFTLEAMDIVPIDTDVIVKTRGSFRFVVTRDTIRGIFPHLLGNEAVIQRIMGLRLTCACSIDLYVDHHGRVVRYAEHADFVKAFAEALKDPACVSILMQGALIHEESMLGEVDFARNKGDKGVPPKGGERGDTEVAVEL